MGALMQDIECFNLIYNTMTMEQICGTHNNTFNVLYLPTNQRRDGVANLIYIT